MLAPQRAICSAAARDAEVNPHPRTFHTAKLSRPLKTKRVVTAGFHVILLNPLNAAELKIISRAEAHQAKGQRTMPTES